MKSVLVTGGTVRLGKAIADCLRADGWRVLTSSHRADAGADIVADLSEPMGAAKLYMSALQILGGRPPDALVNNAALFVGDAAAIQTVGLESPKKLTMMMAGRESGMGAVVNILDSVVIGSDSVGGGSDSVGIESDSVGIGSDSVGGGSDSVGIGSDSVGIGSDSVGADAKRPLPDSKRLYLDAKRELKAFTLSSAMMFAATLRVNGVAPGPVLAPTEVHEKAGETLLARRPTPEAVAAAVSYLLSAESTTGCVIPVDAGQHLL